MREIRTTKTSDITRVLGMMLAAGSLAAGCAQPATEVDGTEIIASDDVRARGVTSYDVAIRPSRVSIGMLFGAHEIGRIEVALDGTTIPAHDSEDEHIEEAYGYAIDYTSPHGTRTVMKGNTHGTNYVGDSQQAWRAVLADPALADALATVHLSFLAGQPPGLGSLSRSDLERAYTGEYPCGNGHHGEGYRINADTTHANGWPFGGCGGDGTYQVVPFWYGTCYDLGWNYEYGYHEYTYAIHGVDRTCHPSCCTSNDCSLNHSGNGPCHPTYGPAGCYVVSHWNGWLGGAGYC